MSGFKASGPVLLALLAVLALGLVAGAALHLLVLALHETWWLHLAVWAAVLWAAWFLWRALRGTRDLDDTAPSRRLTREIEESLARGRAAAARDPAAPEGATPGPAEGASGDAEDARLSPSNPPTPPEPSGPRPEEPPAPPPSAR